MSGRKSILDTISPIVEDRLEELDRLWHAQPEGRRSPTLPVTNDGKVNVRAFATDVCGLRQSQEQHFFKQASLAALINAVAERQGVKPIGRRMLTDIMDKEVRTRMIRTAGDRDDMARTLAEREALIERQRLEILSLTEQLRMLHETGVVLRTVRRTPRESRLSRPLFGRDAGLSFPRMKGWRRACRSQERPLRASNDLPGKGRGGGGAGSGGHDPW